jgi:hypothetical protein
MPHKFEILIENQVYSYENYEDIPQEFDNLIAFLPVIPDGPHTQEQHDEIEVWSRRLQELLKRERK